MSLFNDIDGYQSLLNSSQGSFDSLTVSDLQVDTLETTGNVIVGGNLTVNGTTTTINTTDILIEDSLIKVGHGNISNTNNVGLFGQYNTNKFMGFIYNPTQDKWFLLDNISTEPNLISDYSSETTGLSSLKVGSIQAIADIVLGSQSLSAWLNQALLTTSSPTFNNISVTGTVDSVDLSSFKSDYDSKVNQAVLTTSSPTFVNITGTLVTPAQGNVTSLGTLTDLKINNTKIHIGSDAGLNTQGIGALAIGWGAGKAIQGDYTVAVGVNAGEYNQGFGSLAFGSASGKSQGEYNVSLGWLAGWQNSGINDTVSLGVLAGYTQLAKSICINADSTYILNGVSANALFINPIRSLAFPSGNLLLTYNNTTKEITRDSGTISGYVQAMNQSVSSSSSPGFGGVAINSTKWGYLGGLNQALATSNSPVFSGLTLSSPLITTSTIDGRDVGNDGANLDTLFTTLGLGNLTALEVNQLKNIDTTAISIAEWGYLGAMNQGIASTDSPSFVGLTLSGNIITSGLVDGRDISSDGSNLDTLMLTGVTGLTPAEIAQLLNINTHDITNTEWGYLASQDQGIATTNSPTFVGLTLSGALMTSSTIDGRDVSADGVILDNLNTTLGLNRLSYDEITQLANINATSISTGQWVYIGGLNQGLSTSNNPTFTGLTLSSPLITTSTIDGRDVGNDGSILDNLNTTIGLGSLTASEVSQLQNIGTSTISSTEWDYLANLNQSLTTTSDVKFNTMALTTLPNASKTNSVFYDTTTKALSYSTAPTAGSGGFGDVVGPGSSTDTQICLFNGLTGKLLKTSTATITSGGEIKCAYITATDNITCDYLYGSLSGAVIEPSQGAITLVGTLTDFKTSDNTPTLSGTNFTTTAGILHNTITTGVLTSSLIVNADITNSTITNAKLSAISSTNTVNNIVVRDANGDFACRTITATNLGGSLTTALQTAITAVGTLGNLTVTNPITGSISGNAGTATILQTGRTINGTSFNGSANITVTSAGSTLTGTTLASNIVTSSLTTVGTISNLRISDNIIRLGPGTSGTSDTYGISIGTNSSNTSQGFGGTTVGIASGQSSAAYTVSVGWAAGQVNAGAQSVCLGTIAGNSGCGANTVCLGYGAGYLNAPSGCVILNGSGSTLSPSTSSAFYCNPVRTDSSRTHYGLGYNDTTKEIIKQTNYYHTEEFTGYVYLNGVNVANTNVYVVINGRCITINWGDFNITISSAVSGTVVLYVSSSNSRPYLKPKLVTNKAHVSQWDDSGGYSYYNNIVQIDRDLDASSYWDGRIEFFATNSFQNYNPASPSTIYNYAGSITYYSDS